MRPRQAVCCCLCALFLGCTNTPPPATPLPVRCGCSVGCASHCDGCLKVHDTPQPLMPCHKRITALCLILHCLPGPHPIRTRSVCSGCNTYGPDRASLGPMRTLVPSVPAKSVWNLRAVP